MADVITLGSVGKIFEVVVKIKEAVKTVKQNERECRGIQRLATIVEAQLKQLTEAMKEESNNAAMQDLAESLENALELVNKCQKKHVILRCLGGGGTANDLHRARMDIHSKLQVGTFVNTIQDIIMLTNILQSAAAAARPPPPPPNIVLNAAGFTRFGFSELKAATNDFSDQNIVGQGGFSTVYKVKETEIISMIFTKYYLDVFYVEANQATLEISRHCLHYQAPLELTPASYRHLHSWLYEYMINLNQKYYVSYLCDILTKRYCYTALPLITMATTPEEFFIKDLMEHPPQSPPVFFDFPRGINGNGEVWHHVPNNDTMLPYISRFLKEDDIEGKLIDDPDRLQAQQPFAQILSSPSIGTNTGNVEGVCDLLQEGDDGDEENTLKLELSKGTYAVQAFLKGKEEANMLLPKDINCGSDDLVNQMVRESSNSSGVNTRYTRNHHLDDEVRRNSKAVMMIKEPEQNCPTKMIDEMMLHGYQTCIKEMEMLCISMNKNVDNKNRKSGSKAARDDVVDISTLLIQCAQAVAANNHNTANELLKQIKKHASATGDATQRLAQCFTKALEARLMGTGSLLWQLHLAERHSMVELLKAYSLYFTACCFNKVAILFSTMTIMEAMVGKSRLHIVDYGMCLGFQWAGLLRLLASREGAPPEVRITSIGRPKPKFCPAQQIEEIGCRLSKCANEFGLPSFKFHTILAEWEDVCIKDLNKDADEVLVMNDFFSLSSLMDESMFFDIPNPRDTVLNNITKMRPDVFIQGVSNRTYGSSFLARFREALFQYTALFDMFDATIPRESKSRLMLEQVILGRAALNTIACEGLDLVERPEKYRQWQSRNQRAGLRQLPLKSSIVNVLKDEVKKHHHKDFLICEDGKWLLQGWMGRVLYAHSTWVAKDASS